MKYHVLFMVFFVGLVSINSLAEKIIPKIYIADGVLSYCYAPDELDAAVELYVMDLGSGEIRRHYLPGSIYLSANGTQASADGIVKFPLAWAVENQNFLIVLPDLMADAMGRIIFRIWSSEDIYNLPTQKLEGFILENQIMRYRGYWYGQSIAFMNSVPFSSGSVTYAANHLWYDADCESILARVPLQKPGQNEWSAAALPELYRWIVYSVPNGQSVTGEDSRHNGFTPYAAIQTQGKKILSDNGDVIVSENADWLIWGMNRENKPASLQITLSKEMHLTEQRCSSLPELVLLNEDSGYAMLFYNRNSHSLNPTDLLNDIVKYLNDNKLLKKYSAQPVVKQPNAEVLSQQKNVGSQRGLLDPPPPEEAERLKQEFLASQPLKELFTATELEGLFTEPDYAAIHDPLQLSEAYDWAGKYPESLAALENANGLEAKFELGRFLKHGRPGIPADRGRANTLFAEVVSTVEAQGGASSSADDCLAGRACREYVPENWTENVDWRKRAGGFFQKAIRRGYRPAYYYSQYYERHSSDNNPEELLKALPSDNWEVRGFIAGLAAMNPRFKKLRKRDDNLAAIREAIQAHSNTVQCILGMLYLVSDTDPDALLRYNSKKAKFWLHRAADRGDEDAVQVLQSDSRLRGLEE